jgi:hypothetical protein
MERQDQSKPGASAEPVVLEGGTYEVIRKRLNAHADALRGKLESLNADRKAVFGAVENRLLASERISTENNCVPRDIIAVGNHFIFGYNVFVGLRNETAPADVFAIYRFEDGAFRPCPLDLIDDERFRGDFFNLYRFYRHTRFAKFAVLGSHLFMIFRTGKNIDDIKTFKWLIRGNKLEYLDNRSDHEFCFPPQHQFEWTRVTQDMHRSGLHPHISIEDRVFVETVGGDLTIKIEDNTETGEGIYAEPVDDPDQMLSDAEIYYSIIANLILLKIRPYQETAFRYILYNEKTQTAVRIDSIRDACVLLPEGHGLVFPKGYYLQSGQLKQFETDMEQMVFEKRLDSPNGEDFLYIFYNQDSGVYVLLFYNIIRMEMAVPLVCNGYCSFADGTFICFRADGQAQKHHVIQVWKTPFCHPDHVVEARSDSPLYKIGNKSIVRCMAECTELLRLIDKEDSYLNLYLDISRKAQDIRDSYFWIGEEETHNLAAELEEIRKAAAAAMEEYEKVVRTRENTRRQIAEVRDEVRKSIAAIDYHSLTEVSQYVSRLAELRTLRGRIISLRDLRYADLEQIDALETQTAEHTDTLSAGCVEFLLRDDALRPYEVKAAALGDAVENLKKVTECKERLEQIARTAGELELLADVVSNLKIEDAVQTAAIVENISRVYALVNRSKAAVTGRTKDLAREEGQAEFASQLKLLEQSVISFLDLCDSPAKCEEYLTKSALQIETLEGRFADFDEFIVRLADKREEIYNAFESRKIALVERQNQKAAALMTAAERILKGIETRVRALKTVDEINGFFSADRMVERIRETIAQLTDLGDSVKAEDVKGRLKTLRQDAVRQLKDRQALYEDGESIIRLGSYRFSVNRQALEGAVVCREGRMFYHLAGTGLFQPLEDEEIVSAADLWNLERPSESPAVSRAEYLAWQMFKPIREQFAVRGPAWLRQSPEAKLAAVQTFMGPRFEEGYIKGVHDADAVRLLDALCDLYDVIDLLRFAPQVRAAARLFWNWFCPLQDKGRLAARIRGAGVVRTLFDADRGREDFPAQLMGPLEVFARQSGRLLDGQLEFAAEYLFEELALGDSFILSGPAADLAHSFRAHLAQNGFEKQLQTSLDALADDPAGAFDLLCAALHSYQNKEGLDPDPGVIHEAAVALMEPAADRRIVRQSVERRLDGLRSDHPTIAKGTYTLNLCNFIHRLTHHEKHVVPRFVAFRDCKKRRIDEFAQRYRLDQFQPRVMSTFVRNKLIDTVYLPLIGANLAKQIGTADETKRTDRQGLLLLISPPGYGKTTLMEYVANRLGLTFVKINGPALGRRVISLDPAEAPNAAAREEIQKLNLSFEMGDNVMIYIDDIQHTSPEFLQKFISLCDAQRKIEGIHEGRPRTYDLRGKRVCVVMAGNPYTESGEKFKIPDMLSNRADIYNIGDIVGDNYDAFMSSYIENALTSNPVLESLARRSQADVYAVMKLAETGQKDGIDFEGAYGADELEEYVAVMKKLFVVREVVLKVNRQYILSAAQADEYRTEPPFLLQGSYRNMNRIAAGVLPVMNERELWTLIFSNYEQDAQTLASGAEASLLKFRELTGRLSETEAQRWADIKKTFARNKLLGADDEDRIGKLIRQLNGMNAGLESIKDALADGLKTAATPKADDPVQTIGREILDRMNQVIESIRFQTDSEQQIRSALQQQNLHTLSSVMEEQFRTMEMWLTPVRRSDADRKEYCRMLIARFEEMIAGYERLINALKERYDASPLEPGKTPALPADVPDKPAAKKKKP